MGLGAACHVASVGSLPSVMARLDSASQLLFEIATL